MRTLSAWLLLLGKDYVIAMLMLTVFAATLIMGWLGSKAYEIRVHKSEGANQKTYAQWAVDTWSFSMVIVNIPGVRLALVLFYVLFLAYQIILVVNKTYSLTNFYEWGIVTIGAILSLLMATYQHRVVSQRLEPYTH